MRGEITLRFIQSVEDRVDNVSAIMHGLVFTWLEDSRFFDSSFIENRGGKNGNM